MNEFLDLVGAALLFAGSVFCLAAAVGIVRFPDVLARLHAATKPQVFGLVLILGGVVFTVRTWQVPALCLLMIVLQILTAPVSGHMVARAAYRTDQWDDGRAVVDELGHDLTKAGFVNRPEDEEPTPTPGAPAPEALKE